MWSKKRRRERESKCDSAGSGKEDPPVVVSPPPQLKAEPPKAVPHTYPPTNQPTNQPANQPVVPVAPVDATLKPLLSVPLPSAPLTSSILDSLQSSLTTDPNQAAAGGMSLLLGGSSNGQSIPVEAAQAVLTHCERSVKMQSPSSSSFSLANRTQVFDYGNQSNKALECAAIKQLENDYRQDRW